MSRNPGANKMRKEQNRHKNGCAENYVLAELHNGRRNKEPATHIESVQRVGQTVWRKRHRRGKPDQAHGEIEAAGKRIEGPRLGVVDAAKPVGLHQAVPNAPKENDQQNSLQVPPKEGDTRYEQK